MIDLKKIVGLDVSKLSAHDRALVERADRTTDCCFWWNVPDANEAEAPEAREYLKEYKSHLYLREEAQAGLL